MNEALEYWLGKLGALTTATTGTRGIAPHMPLMLLSLMDLIEDGQFADGWIPYDVRIAQRFRDYWALVVDRQQNSPDIPMPFHALGSRRNAIWHRFTRDGALSESKVTTRLCQLNQQLASLMQDPAFRTKARRVLICTYFPADEQVALCAKLHLPLPNTTEVAAFKTNRDAFKNSQKKGRDAAFKSSVIAGYRYTCALTGCRFDVDDRTLVEAAHIHQHSESGNDDPRNGLALSPTAHWLFDRGVWTAVPKGHDFVIEVASGSYFEVIMDEPSIERFHGRKLSFTADSTLRPDAKYLAWHLKQRFRSSLH